MWIVLNSWYKAFGFILGLCMMAGFLSVSGGILYEMDFELDWREKINEVQLGWRDR